MKRLRFFLLVAFASAAAGFGTQNVSASVIPPDEEDPGEAAANGNLYHREGGTPAWICWCGGTECAPCAGGAAT